METYDSHSAIPKFISAPSYIAVKIEKEILFSAREKEIHWAEQELSNAFADKVIFLKYGRSSLEDLFHDVSFDLLEEE